MGGGIRTRCLAAALACVAVLAAGCGPRHEPPLTIGTNVWAGYETLHLARDLGFYDRLPLRLVELAASTQSMDALRVGKLDLAGLTLDEALTLAHDGVPIAIVWVMDVSAGADAIVARPGIRRLADLRGRRIGVEQTALGAYLLDAALRSAGLDAGQITVVPLPVDEHVAAFRNGSVDAVVTFDPSRQTLVHDGAHVLFDSRALPGEIVDVLVARRAALDCCAARIRQVIDGQRRALAHLAAHREDALARMAPRLGQPPADVAAALAGMSLPDGAANHALLAADPPALRLTAERLSRLMVERGLLARPVDAAALIDGRFAREATR